MVVGDLAIGENETERRAEYEEMRDGELQPLVNANSVAATAAQPATVPIAHILAASRCRRRAAQVGRAARVCGGELSRGREKR